jgi:Cu/Ag efflux protein CusF
MFNSDKPIRKFDDDILGRGYFARQLGQAILSFDSIDNITIGLYGKWGTGKTSIINLALKEIENQVSDMKEEDKPTILMFEPWNFTDNQNLIVQFFNQLKNKLKVKNYAGFAEGVAEALDSYADAFELASEIPVIGKYISLFKMTANFASDDIKSRFNSTNISDTKDKLIKELKKRNKKIIVVIDDIDRLSNEQIRMVFQLVNQVVGLPNIIYLLSMDKDIVVRALKKVQDCDGEEYLEKIVQVPFLIPKLEKDKVLNLFLYKINEILNGKENLNFDKNYWIKVYWKCINPYINTIRDVNRIINTFQFRYNLVCDEVNFVDMLAIEVIQTMKPQIYEWIIKNKNDICGCSSGYSGVVYVEQDKKREEYIRKLREIGGEEALEIIATLFPKIDKEINHYYESVSEDNLRKNQRIADPDKFKVYFSLDLLDVAIPHSRLIDSIKNMNKDELQNLISELNDSKNIISYLRELKSYSDEVPIDRIYLLIEILYRNMQSFVGEVWNSSISFSAEQYVEWCIDSLLKRIEASDDKYIIYKGIIENADIKTLNSMAPDINRIELAYGRLASERVAEEKQIIKIEQLNKLEKIYVTRINYILGKHQSLFECNKLYFIIYMWKNFDEKSCYKYISNLLKEPINILKFIVRMSSEWKGTGGRGWEFSEDNYIEFVSKDKVVDVINRYFKGEIVEKLNEEEEAKMASFILTTTKEYHSHISEREALEYVKQMKQ